MTSSRKYFLCYFIHVNLQNLRVIYAISRCVCANHIELAATWVINNAVRLNEYSYTRNELLNNRCLQTMYTCWIMTMLYTYSTGEF